MTRHSNYIMRKRMIKTVFEPIIINNTSEDKVRELKAELAKLNRSIFFREKTKEMSEVEIILKEQQRRDDNAMIICNQITREIKLAIKGEANIELINLLIQNNAEKVSGTSQEERFEYQKEFVSQELDKSLQTSFN